MYEAFYNLKAKPFSILPDPDFLYWGKSHRIAFAMLKFGSWNQMGFTVITGQVGCGKTTLINHLLATMQEDTTVGLVSNMREDSGELLNWVLLAFDQPLSEKPYPMLFQQFKIFVQDEFAQGRRVVLVIDEAQNLGLKALEELRLLFNINTSKDHLIQLVLVGQPELRQQLISPQLTQFAQRISSDFHLNPLPEDEVADYIGQRLEIAGGISALFSPQAIETIAFESRGIPRVINILCETSLVYAFSLNEPTVTESTVKKVIRDKSEFGVFATRQPGASPDFASA